MPVTFGRMEIASESWKRIACKKIAFICLQTCTYKRKSTLVCGPVFQTETEGFYTRNNTSTWYASGPTRAARTGHLPRRYYCFTRSTSIRRITSASYIHTATNVSEYTAYGTRGTVQIANLYAHQYEISNVPPHKTCISR